VSQQLGYAIVAGLGTGGMYAFIAISYTVILASSGVFSFAQGSIVMGGALAFYGLAQVANIPVLGAFAIVVFGGALLGMTTDLLAVLPVTNRKGVSSLTEGTLVTTFGLGLLLNTLAGDFFGYNTIPVKGFVSSMPVHLIGLEINPIYLVMISLTIVISVGLELVLRRTKIGLLLRVTVEDVEGAQIGGVSVSRVVFLAFAFGGGMAALAGALLSPLTFASVGLSTELILYGFAGMAIGGFGSFVGALVGGLSVGVVSELVATFWNPNYVDLVIYGSMVALLVVRPRGLFGAPGGFGAAALREV
jgi:branched-chain amino acid transport system permease protein